MSYKLCSHFADLHFGPQTAVTANLAVKKNVVIASLRKIEGKVGEICQSGVLVQPVGVLALRLYALLARFPRNTTWNSAANTGDPRSVCSCSPETTKLAKCMSGCVVHRPNCSPFTGRCYQKCHRGYDHPGW